MDSIATDINVDVVKYNAYAQKRYEVFSGTEREKLKELADLVVQKENPKRYELAAQCLKEIYEYSKQSDNWYNFLGCAVELLNPSQKVHLDFKKDNPLINDIYEKINYPLEDGHSDDDV